MARCLCQDLRTGCHDLHSIWVRKQVNKSLEGPVSLNAQVEVADLLRVCSPAQLLVLNGLELLRQPVEVLVQIDVVLVVLLRFGSLAEVGVRPLLGS